MELLEVLGFGIYAVGFFAALAEVPSTEVIPFQGGFVQVGDILAFAGAGILAFLGHEQGDRGLMFIALGLILLDVLRFLFIGSPLSANGVSNSATT